MIGMRAADASIECRVRPARIGEAGALSELCFRSKQVWGYDDDFMAFCREPLRVKPEEIAAGNVWVAAAADQSIVGVVALAPAGEPATLDLGWSRGGVCRLLLAHAIGKARRRG